jgi:acetate kinase
LQQAVCLDAHVLAAVERASELAPLHNLPSLAGIQAAMDCLGTQVPMVAVFDTAFHHTLPVYASTYALPRELATRHHIRRYGFHGLAHASLAAGYGQATGRPLDTVRLITFQLGHGCSVTAIRAGESVDTSMGLTPLEGLVMSTRSGDLDPAVVNFLARREGVTAEQVEQWLNERSGLLGISGLSPNMRQLLTAAEHEQHAGATLAIDVFCYRARKYLGAYLAVLGSAEAVVFGGGIGERAPTIRSRICAGMEWCGLALDPERNARAIDVPSGQAVQISRDDARLAAYVVAVDEETQMARETVRCLRNTV